jgi:hypothetical protein
MPFSNPLNAGETLILDSLHSPNYDPGMMGWSINKDGTAEFNSVVIRGGTTEGGVALYYSGTPAHGNLTGSIASQAGIDPFSNNYLAGFTSYGTDGSYIEQWENGNAQIVVQPPSKATHDFAPGEITALSFVETVGDGIISAELILNSPSDNNVPGGDTNSSITLANGNGGDSVISIDGGRALLDAQVETQVNSATLTVNSSLLQLGTSVEKSSVLTDSGTVTSTGYVGARTGTTNVCGTAFMSPPSGKVMVQWHCGVSNSSATAFTLISFEIRTGSTVGSGTVIVAASDNVTIQHSGTTAEESKSTFYPLDAGQLQPNTQYNIRLMYRVSGTTGTINRPRLSVTPVMG